MNTVRLTKVTTTVIPTLTLLAFLYRGADVYLYHGQDGRYHLTEQAVA